MANATFKLFVAGLLIALPAGAAKADRMSRAGEAESGNACTAPTVTIYLDRRIPVDLRAEMHAIHVANRVFQSTGVHLRWRRDGPVPEPIEGNCSETIELQIDPVAARGYDRDAMAYATPWAASGTRIHVFFDRVSEKAVNSPNLLGYVLAHEIGHVLQGVARHSGDGIMKAHWDRRDHNLMGVYALQFTSEDAALILDGAKANSK